MQRSNPVIETENHQRLEEAPTLRPRLSEMRPETLHRQQQRKR